MKKYLKIIGISIAALIVVALIGMKTTEITPISFGWHQEISQSKNIAIGGYDVVSYFTDNKALKGNAKFSTTLDNVKWYFSSTDNLEIFISNPETYTPIYGGHCVFAASKGFAVDGNPESWSIQNSKLMLFADDAVKKECLDNLTDVLSEGNKNWK